MDMVQEQVRTIVTLLMKRPITEAVATQIKSMEGYRHLEVVNGEWVGLEGRDEMTTGEEHGWIESLLLVLLGNFILAKRLGRFYPGDVTWILDGEPGDIRLMREPDVSFIAQENVTPTSGFIYRAPDLAVEIVSPSQSYNEMIKKMGEYFQHGTKVVWIVLPDQKQIEVHQLDGSVKRYSIGDSIPGGDLLPGFTLEVSAVFQN
jgi:Uma2 family endonuclease